jgi:hypothetical protein
MKHKFCFHSVIAMALFAVIATGISGCKSGSPLDSALKKAVEIKFDHVANIPEIRFDENLNLGADGAIGSVSSRNQGFWAVFVICSIDVQGREVETFNYDAANFFVEYEGVDYKLPLLPNTLTFGASTQTNNAANTPLVAAGIIKKLHLGPMRQAFPRGFYPSLNYRIAILIPNELRTYRGEQLTLRYGGHPTIVLGGGNRPVTLGPFRLNELSGVCRTPVQ